FLMEAPKKENGTDNPAVKPRPVAAAGVLGAGIMGGGIGQVLANIGVPVRLKDIRHEFVSKGLATAYKIFDDKVRRKRMKPRELEQKMALISATLDYKGFHHLDYVIEAVLEVMDVKKKVLQEAEAALPEQAIFATNTSSLSVTELATASKRPAQVVG